MKRRLILAIDIGSSSVRCSAYEIIQQQPQQQQDHHYHDYHVKLLDENCRTSRIVRSVQPNTGKIQLMINKNDQNDNDNDDNNNNNNKTGSSLMDNLDDCIDELLDLLRTKFFIEKQQEQQQFQIVAVAFSSFVMNLIGVDMEGNIVDDETASISYACNSPTVTKQCQTLRSRLGQETLERMYQNTGAPIHSAYALPQLLDIYNNNNINNNKIYKWQTIASICISRWIGIPFLPISYSEASWTGLLNFRTCQYESTILNLLPKACVDALPDLADITGGVGNNNNSDDGDAHYYSIGEDCCSTTTNDNDNNNNNNKRRNPYWDRWPELRGGGTGGGGNGGGCRFFLGLGDGACANIGSKCSTINRIAVTIGTSAAARVCLPLPIIISSSEQSQQQQQQQQIVPPTSSKEDHVNSSSSSNNNKMIQVPRGLFCYRIDRNHILLGGALTDGGSVVEWIANLLNLTSKEALEFCMTQVQDLLEKDYNNNNNGTNTGGSIIQPLTVVPFLGGERSTGYRDGATGAILGLTRETTQAHLVKSCLEGVTLRLNAVLQLIRKTMTMDDDDEEEEEERAKEEVEDSSSVERRNNPCIIVASGKALEINSLWRQMLSDCSGMNVIMDGETEEGTSRGAAIVVANALLASSGSFIDENLNVKYESKPNPSAERHWRDTSNSQESFIDAISPLFGAS